jgi:predicted lipoprotein with Yx(FWY)xxD motif
MTTTSAHVTVAGGALTFLTGETTRPGGARQITYAGHPLYLFRGDSRPGATSGQGSTAFGARWDVLTTTGKEVIGRG